MLSASEEIFSGEPFWQNLAWQLTICKNNGYNSLLCYFWSVHGQGIQKGCNVF